MLHSPLIVSFVRSLIIHRLVSKETRTVASKGIWKATRMYCVRIVGTWRDEYGRKRSRYRIGGVLLWQVVTLQCVSLECHEKWGVHIGDVMWCGVRAVLYQLFAINGLYDFWSECVPLPDIFYALACVRCRKERRGKDQSRDIEQIEREEICQPSYNSCTWMAAHQFSKASCQSNGNTRSCRECRSCVTEE